MTPSSMQALFVLVVLLDGVSSLLMTQCCASRVTMSRVAPFASARVALPCMCEAPEESAEAAPVDAAEPAAEAAAVEEEKPRRARAPRAAKTKLDELELGVEIQGTVRRRARRGAALAKPRTCARLLDACHSGDRQLRCARVAACRAMAHSSTLARPLTAFCMCQRSQMSLSRCGSAQHISHWRAT